MDRPREKKTGAERRGFSRVEFPEGKLAVEVGTGVVSLAQASVRNISRGGILLSLLEAPVDGTGVGHCVVRFLDENRQVHPAATRGTIRRKGTEGPVFQVAIEFAEPLETLGPLGNGDSPLV